MAEIVFLPESKAVQVAPGETLRAAAEKAGVHISSICGGDGTCGKCRVILRQAPPGRVQTEPTAFLTPEEVDQGYVLACQARVQGDVLVEVPQESRWEGRALLSDLDPARFGQVGPADPAKPGTATQKIFLSLPEPTLTDNRSDWERLQQGLTKALEAKASEEQGEEAPTTSTEEAICIDLPLLRKLPHLLREHHWQITVPLGRTSWGQGSQGIPGRRKWEVLDLEPGNTSGQNFGVAVDIGTTTVVAHLVDLNTGRTVEQQGRYNSQIRYGEDVISRIVYATQEEEGLRRLQSSIVRDLNQLISEMSQKGGVARTAITGLVCAGNTTMTHLLLGLEVAPIRRAPYIPVVQHPPVIRAAEVGIQIHERGLLYALPGVGAYVGADITAGIMASGLHRRSELSLFFDIGTNGEVVLGNSDWLICCSASAGPSFEGGEMKSGMRAAPGAIERVSLGPNGQVALQVIGGGRPRGICGSGLIDCVAELARWNYVDRAGRFQSAQEGSWMCQGELERAFILVPAEAAETDQDVVVTQSDIDVFLRSKGAVYTAAESLVSHLGLSFADVDHVYIAGGFGNYLELRNAIAIGLMPDLPLEKFQFLGNAALAGAQMALRSHPAMEEVAAIADRMTYFELSTDPKFMNEFVSSLFLPHTDIEKFPSLIKD